MVKRKNKVREFIKYEEQITREEKECWEQRFEIANLLGVSDKEILERAKESYRRYVQAWLGKGFSGSGRWKDLNPRKQYRYISAALPRYNEDINEVWNVVRIMIDDFDVNFSIEPLDGRYIVKVISPHPKRGISLMTRGMKDEDIAKTICDVVMKLSYPRRIATKKSEGIKKVISTHYEELITKLSGKYQSLKIKTIEGVLFYLSLTPKEQKTFDKFHSIKHGNSMPIKGILVPFFGMTKDLRGVNYKSLAKEIEQEIQTY